MIKKNAGNGKKSYGYKKISRKEWRQYIKERVRIEKLMINNYKGDQFQGD